MRQNAPNPISISIFSGGDTPDPRHWGLCPRTPGRGREVRKGGKERAVRGKGSGGKGEGGGREGEGVVCVIAVGGIDPLGVSVCESVSERLCLLPINLATLRSTPHMTQYTVFHKQEAQLMLTNLRDAFASQSGSPHIALFHMLGMVSYCAIVTLSLRRAVFYDIRLQNKS